MRMAVARDFMPTIMGFPDQAGETIRHLAKEEARHPDAVLPAKVEQGVKVRFDTGLESRPFLLGRCGRQSRDVEPILDVNGQDVPHDLYPHVGPFTCTVTK